ncbi:MAG: hypothetical protein JXL80_05385 [Planctomycetes bacterium]|nr:hypothetical protein [Planctomycetota bacterium]
MNRDGFRTKVGEHPIVAVVLPVYALLFLVVSIVLLVHHYGVGHLKFLTWPGVAACLLPSGAWAYYVGCVRGRAGLKADVVVTAMFPVMLPTAVLFVWLLVVQQEAFTSFAADRGWSVPLMLAVILAPPMCAGGIGLGGALAQLTAVYMIRRGKWEKTVPPETRRDALP